MEVFGDGWQGYLDKISADWRSKVTDADTVLLAGDLSWAMKLDEAVLDAAFLHNLPGTKVIIRGNHDYWWSSYNKIKCALPKDIIPLQNNAVRLPCGVVLCGSRGWTIPTPDSPDEDVRIFSRELVRMQLALTEAHKLLQDGDELIAMIHYPPFVGRFEPTPMTQLFDDFRVDKVVYGHIHGRNSFHKREVMIHAIPYYLTSCDMTDFQLTPIL